MTDGPTEQFRAAIAHRLGLHFDDGKLELLAELLRRRAEITQHTIASYPHWLASEAPHAELSALAEELTVGETYFFRNSEQFDALARVVVPERMRAQAARRTLHVLSAGCASGEEAYSLAIVVREALADPSWDVSVRAVDMNPLALARASRARYGAWSLRETSAEMQRRWFRQSGRETELDPTVQTAVRFEQRNLADDDPALWCDGLYDVVFCRNVLIYFTPEAARAVVANIERALAPGGYLFLGHAETLRGLSQQFHLCHTHGTFYYQRLTRPAAIVRPDPVAIGPVVDTTSSWVEAIQRASERVRALTDLPRGPAAPKVPGDLSRARELLQQERFGDALASMPADTERDTDALLLRAVLLAHSGRLDDAEHACRSLLGIDELNAGAHYVMALCRESAGDRRAAVNHDQIALYLDPTFAMARLHLGLLARRAGDLGTARRELADALLLLQREDASRLLLFGGGFRREALLGVCKSELAMAGEA